MAFSNWLLYFYGSHKLSLKLEDDVSNYNIHALLMYWNGKFPSPFQFSLGKR